MGTNFNNPIPRSGRAFFHESSKQRSPRDADATPRHWIKYGNTAQQLAQMQEVVQQQQRTLAKLRPRKPGLQFGGGIQWQEPYRELNFMVDVPKGTWVYVSPNNELVTDGIVDLVSLAADYAVPGIWEAAQDVPASTDGLTYNVPQLPYPGATGTPSGDPLQGDLDGANVFWILISAAQVCT